MREAVIEKYLVKRVKELGGEVRKVKWIGRNGAPDRVVMRPSWGGVGGEDVGVVVWIELKAPGKKPTAAQFREHARMLKMGQVVVVVDSIEGVDHLLA